MQQFILCSLRRCVDFLSCYCGGKNVQPEHRFRERGKTSTSWPKNSLHYSHKHPMPTWTYPHRVESMACLLHKWILLINSYWECGNLVYKRRNFRLLSHEICVFWQPGSISVKIVNLRCMLITNSSPCFCFSLYLLSLGWKFIMKREDNNFEKDKGKV